jgi:hypothetical protein
MYLVTHSVYSTRFAHELIVVYGSFTGYGVKALYFITGPHTPVRQYKYNSSTIESVTKVREATSLPSATREFDVRPEQNKHESGFTSPVEIRMGVPVVGCTMLVVSAVVLPIKTRIIKAVWNHRMARFDV